MKRNKKGFLFPCLIVSLALNSAIVCHAATLGNPAGSSADIKNVAAWEEEYTDTDTEKGTLAVRGEVFEGFHGEVTVHFTGLVGGRSFEVRLNQDGDYMANLSLTGDTYHVSGVTAISELREYDCYAEPETVEVTADSVTVCNVYVMPCSVQKFPEDTQVQPAGASEGTKTEEPEEQAEPEEQTEPVVPEDAPGRGEQGKIPILGILGMVLILICTGSLIYIRKREK